VNVSDERVPIDLFGIVAALADSRSALRRRFRRTCGDETRRGRFRYERI